MSRLVVFLFFLLQLQPLSVVGASNNGGFGFMATLRRVDANKGYTEAERLGHSVKRSKSRVAALQSLAKVSPANAITAARILVHASKGEYLMDLGIGTPPRFYSAILATTHDLIWTQCAASYFDPAKSKTYRPLPCSSPMCDGLDDQEITVPECIQGMCQLWYHYVDSSKRGVLANETFTFGTNRTRVTVPSIAFGCVDLNSSVLPAGSGMVGLGRGSLSLVRQLGYTRFSYCLTSFQSPTPSRLYFGEYATLQSTNMSSGAGSVQSTPFIINPDRPSMYFLNMTGISIGGYRLRIDPSVFAIDQDFGHGGVIIDSATTITHLRQPAYDAVRAALVSQIKLPLLNVTLPDGMDTCFVWPPPPRRSVTLPELVFHFDGADMELPLDNYLTVDDRSGGLCLAMGPSIMDISVIGSFQQQNFHVLYDLKNNFLSFVPAPCTLV